jgi:hypothetical protein
MALESRRVATLDGPRSAFYPCPPCCSKPGAMSCGVLYAQVAQSVEQGTENPRVGGSIPPLGTDFGELAGGGVWGSGVLGFRVLVTQWWVLVFRTNPRCLMQMRRGKRNPELVGPEPLPPIASRSRQHHRSSLAMSNGRRGGCVCRRCSIWNCTRPRGTSRPGSRTNFALSLLPFVLLARPWFS